MTDPIRTARFAADAAVAAVRAAGYDYKVARELHGQIEQLVARRLHPALGQVVEAMARFDEIHAKLKPDLDALKELGD